MDATNDTLSEKRGHEILAGKIVDEMNEKKSRNRNASLQDLVSKKEKQKTKKKGCRGIKKTDEN